MLLCTRTRPFPVLRQKTTGRAASVTDTLTVSSRTTPRNPNTRKSRPLSPNDAREPLDAHGERRRTLGEGLRAVEAGDIAESDQISLRNH